MELFAADGHDADGCERVTGKSGMRPYKADNWMRCWFAGIDPEKFGITQTAQVGGLEGSRARGTRQRRRDLSLR